ncbi:hypothetical protein QAD02_018122 [Eretmocerus hayati]|uniref:Uncharacterized protein n=2 Tax=Eretmocerus hayati TaxID=131215 RepID=A0ACC2P3B8_9HYME|nr:hypothetical protein QAD02_012061 [Eretmocerus hayati]KAJ8682330.1 hypothetical protein QAD02_018122 [Eretmocerus hayati]
MIKRLSLNFEYMRRTPPPAPGAVSKALPLPTQMCALVPARLPPQQPASDLVIFKRPLTPPPRLPAPPAPGEEEDLEFPLPLEKSEVEKLLDWGEHVCSLVANLSPNWWPERDALIAHLNSIEEGSFLQFFSTHLLKKMDQLKLEKLQIWQEELERKPL